MATKKDRLGEGILKEQFVQQRTNEHPCLDARLLMRVYKRNVLEQCV